MSESSKFYIHWNRNEIYDRVCKALKVSCMDKLESVVDALDLDAWFVEHQKYKGGMQGVIQIIGNSDQLERSIKCASEIEAALKANPDLDEDSLMAMRNAHVPAGEKVSIGLSKKITAEEVESRLRMMFSRGVVRAVENVHAVVVTSGSDRGPISFIGEACKDRGNKIPVLGVVPLGASTWPGDDREGSHQRVPLEPNHTHCVGLASNDTYDAAVYRFLLTDALIAPKKRNNNKKLPVAAVLCSGGEAALEEALQCSRRGWPIAVVKGSGGAADAIAWVCEPRNRSYFIPNPKLMEIAREAKVEIIDLETVDGKVTKAMLERLFDTMLRGDGAEDDDDGDDDKKGGKKKGGGKKGGSGGGGGGKGGGDDDGVISDANRSKNLVIAWEQIIIYRSNATAAGGKQGHFDSSINYLSVLLICMVALKTYFLAHDVTNSFVKVIFDLPLLFLPILISMIVGINNRLQYGLKSKILTAGADVILSEIYKYRTATGSYGEKSDERLGYNVQKIVDSVTATIVGEMSLSRSTLDTIRMHEFAVSPEDDGFSPLSPDMYIKQRLVVNMNKYSSQTLNLGEFFFNARLATFIFGATGTILAGAQLSIFVAVSTAFSVSIQGRIESKSPMTNLKSLNRCIGELVDAKAWWKARTQIEQANPLKFSELVRITEGSLMDLLYSTNPAASNLTGEEDQHSTLDVNGFVNDILSNIDDGKVKFSQSWMDKYYHFFEQYQEWYGVVNNKRLRTQGPPTMPLMKENEQPTSIWEEGPDDALTRHEKFEILWDPDEFLLRTSTVVTMAPPMLTTSVKQMAKMLKLEKWMMKNSGNPKPAKGKSPVRGVVSIIGTSSALDDFMLNGVDDAGNKLMDLLSGEEALARLRMVFSRGIIAAAHRASAVVMTSGLDMGPAAYTGFANRERQYKVPVVGVVSKATAAWPGDERPGQMDRMPLNPDHTHFVMLPSVDRNSSTDFRMKLAWHYSNEGKLPGIAFIINGGRAAMEGLLLTVRLGWPMVVVKGSGGLADRIADGKKSPGRYVTDPILTEILQEGNLEFIEMSEVDGGLCQQMMDRIFSSSYSMDAADMPSDDEEDDHDHDHNNIGGGSPPARRNLGAASPKRERKGHRGAGGGKDPWVPADLFADTDAYDGAPVELSKQAPNLVAAWERHTTYRANAVSSKSIASTLAKTLLFLGVLSTTVAALLEFTKKVDKERWTGVSSERAETAVLYMNWVLFLIPILSSVMVAIENETRHGLKSALLQSGAEIILSEIYQYRTGVGEYSSPAKNAAMQELLKLEDDRLGSSGVNEMGLSQRAAQEGRISGFRVSPEDDAFSVLTPEDYVSARLEKLSRYYESAALHSARGYSVLNVMIYALGALGSSLALVPDLQIFVAVTTAITSSLVTLMAQEKQQEKVFVFNRSIADLTRVLSWWRSLSPIAKANPQKFNQLVKDVEAVKQNEIRSLFPAAFKGGKDGQGAPTFNSTMFRQDLISNIDSRGEIQFKRTWVERHIQFFLEYEAWMHTQEMWEDIPPDQEPEQKPPIAGAISEEFLESSVVDLNPIRRGYELLVKWVAFWNEGEMTAEDWWNQGPIDPPFIGAVVTRPSTAAMIAAAAAEQ